MSSNSDMESVSISDVEMEEEEEVFVPTAISQPPPQAPVPVAGISLPQSASQPTPKRITMRERALAMRDARLKRNQAKSMKKSGEASGNNPTQNVTDRAQAGDSENGAIVPTGRQEATPKMSRRANSSTALESSIEPNSHESQSLGSKRPGLESKKSEAQAIGKGKRTQLRRESGTKKSAKNNTALVKPNEPNKDPGDTNLLGPHEGMPNGQSTLAKDGSKASKTSSGTRKDQRKRKVAAVAVEGKEGGDDSGHESDVILLQSKVSTAAPPRAKKRARVESAKSAASPKATTRSLKKKKGAAVPQSPSGATTTAAGTEVTVDLEQGGVEAPSKKKKTSKKSTRANVRILDDDEPLVVRDKRSSKPVVDLLSKDVQTSGTGEQNPKPLPPKRRPGRPRKYPKVDAPGPQPPTKATGEEDNLPQAQGNQEAPVSGTKAQRQTRSRGRKVKQAAPDETESAKKSSHEDDRDFQVSKEKATTRLGTRSASKEKSPMLPAPKKIHKPGDDHVAADKINVENVGSKQIEAAAPEVQVNEGPEVQVNEGSVHTVTQSPTRTKEPSLNDTARRSATKPKRIPFALSASPQGLNIMQPRELNMNASRRKSLSHQEGLNRLTSVVDQLQREGEAFIQTEHRICDQLVSFPPESASHVVYNIPCGNFGVPVPEDDRRAIADATLRDAVMHAKLEYQAKQRAAVSQLAENLVKAMKDWKVAKNAVLRDIIPEELRPEAGAPVETFEQNGHHVDINNSRRIMNEKINVPQEKPQDENEEQIEGSGVNEEPTKELRTGNTPRISRQEAVAQIRVLKNAEAMKKFAGYAYIGLNLDCYRSCTILKLCEFDEGLSYDDLYRITPIGKVTLRKKIHSLVSSKNLVEETVELPSGKLMTVFKTAPHIAKMG